MIKEIKLIPYIDDSKKWGFCDEMKDVAIPCSYEGVNRFQNNVASVQLNNKWGLIDKKGEIVIECKFDKRLIFVDELAMAIQGDKFGFVNTQGEIAIPISLELDDHPEIADMYAISEFSCGLARVNKDVYNKRKYGFIDKHGNEIIECKYDFAGNFVDGLASVRFNDKYGFINTNGEIIVPFQYDLAQSFSEGLAVVNIGANYNREYGGYCGGMYGYINETGDIVFPIKYRLATEFHNDIAWVNMNNRWGFIDKLGGEIFFDNYFWAYDEQDRGLFEDGLSRVRLLEKYGYINKNGDKKIRCMYNNAKKFSEGLAAVKLDEEWGYINTEGVEVISFKYDYAGDFQDGLAFVRKGKDSFYINNKGLEFFDEH